MRELKILKERILERQLELFPERSVLCGFRGSIAHNTYIPSTDPNSIDDVDIMCIYTAIPEHYIGLGRVKDYRRGDQIQVDDFDCVHYELRHFVNLLLKSNPTTMLLLWLNKEHYLKATWLGQKLVDNRKLFTSKALYKSFTRYAEDQLNKMQPGTYEGYMGVKRKALVDKYGYDCKNAAHSIRLLKMAIEFLSTGQLNVFRTDDANILIGIKTGKWLISEVKGEASRLLKQAGEAYVKSKLPEEPDAESAEKLLMSIIRSIL